MAVRQKKAGGGPAGAGGGESPYTELEEVLKKVYKAVKGGRTPGKPASIELGGLLVKVYAESRWSGIVIFEVLKSGHPLCKVELYLLNREPSAVDVDCGELEELASRCASGKDCRLSWEEARTAFRLAVWAVSRLAELAGIPAKVERTGLVEARSTWDGEVNMLPCLQVSIDGESYSVCRGVRLRRDPDGGWEVKSVLRLVPIDEAHIKIAEALAELERMIFEHIRRLESEGAKRIHAREHRGEFLRLDEVVLRRRDGTEEALLVPWLHGLNYIGEGLAVVECSDGCLKISDGKLADAVRKDLEEAWGEVVQAVRRYMETGDPRYAALAYIVVEALGRAGLAPA